MTKPPRRAANVPSDAIWDGTSDWEAGPTGAGGIRTGQWRAWRADGELYCFTEYGDGKKS